MQTERVTRSRARTLAATGETPSLAALPDKTPVTRTTRRRAAAAATAPPGAAAAPPCASERVQPVVLFDVTNDQDGVPPSAPPAEVAPEVPAAEVQAEPAPAAEAEPALVDEAEPTAAASLEAEPAPEPAAEGSLEGASSCPASPELAAAEEPPATPAHAVPASPAPACPGATPTGLGLSSLPPLSPTLAAVLPAATPAATPLGGVAANVGRVSDALHAAVQALGGAAASPSLLPVPAPEADLVFHGFGSPLKTEVESPESMPVSISGAVSPMSAMRATPGDAAAGHAGVQQGLDFQLGAERELTLEEMMGTPFPADRDNMSEGGPTPTLYTAPILASVPRPVPTAGTPAGSATPAAAAAAPTPAAVVVRTVSKAHPLTPSRQVVLEEEEQDYIMQTAEEQAVAEAADQQQVEAEVSEADEEMPIAEAAPSPAPEQPAAAAPARLQSKVVVPSPHNYDPRSLRQLRREVADRLAAKQSVAPAGLESDEEGDEGEYIGAAPGGEELTDALGALSLEPGMHHGLRGLPTPAGKHIRFDEETGDVAEVSPRQRVYLRGVPQPQGTHIHFDE